MKISSDGRAEMLKGLASACSGGVARLYGQGGPNEVIVDVKLGTPAFTFNDRMIQLNGAKEGQEPARQDAILSGVVVFNTKGKQMFQEDNVQELRIYKNSIVAVTEMAFNFTFSE